MCQVRKRAPCRLTALPDVLLAHVLRLCAPRDLEALSVAARVVAVDVLPRWPSLWKAQFARRWETLNFPLEKDSELQVESKLRALFKSSTESRMFQVLTHAVVPLPAYADLEQTRRYQGYSDSKHKVQAMHDEDTRPSHVVRFAFNGEELGDDRSVRANVPFPPTYHVAVFKRRNGDGQQLYQIGLVASGYFEIQIVHRNPPVRQTEPQEQPEEGELTSLGLVPASFPLVGRQPGWNQRSYGYHGDDGRLYKQTTRGYHYGPRFGVGDVVGCGVHRDMAAAESRVFFTSNGQKLSRPDEGEIKCSHTNLYPAVGVDSYNEVHVNFGQEPFAHDGIVDELFAECDPSMVAATDLPWYYLHEYNDIGSLLRRSLQENETQTKAIFDGDAKAEAAAKEDGEEMATCMKKWIGSMLTRRQQNRLASNEENASEERAAAAAAARDQ